MALSHTHTGEYIIYRQTLRTPTNDYLLRKTQTDRIKLADLLNKLLSDREVVIFYLNTMTVATQRLDLVEAAPLPPVELTVDRVADQEFPGVASIVFYALPAYSPTKIALDDITQFIVRRAGVDDLLR